MTRALSRTLAHSRALSRTLVALLATLGCAFASPSALAQSGNHKWGGLLYDTFAMDTPQGVKAWTAEDGGRIRRFDPVTNSWGFANTPSDVQDTLHRVFFLDETKGWAVGQGGWILTTSDGGLNWTKLALNQFADHRFPNQAPGQGNNAQDPWEELYDIHFVDANEGWLVGVHSIWHTDDGGTVWTTLTPHTASGAEYPLSSPIVELYAIDIVTGPDCSRMGLIVGQPGIAFRAVSTAPCSSSQDPHLADWRLEWDIVAEHCQGSPACGSAGSSLKGDECQICTPLTHGPWFEAWDVQISHNPTSKLALIVGGFGTVTGMIFGSTDDGVTWVKEYHECKTCPGVPTCLTCTQSPLYNVEPHRLSYFRTLYGVGIFDEDNSAIAAGYNGQHVVRNPATGIWEDRSSFAEGVPTVPGSVVFPLIGAEAVKQASTGQKVGWISGEGGHMRKSVDGGQSWTDSLFGEPNRINDVHFETELVGWHVGQFFRIAKTTFGGTQWTEQTPTATPDAGNFRAVAFAPGGLLGVAVGDPARVPGISSRLPKIRYTQDGGFSDWNDGQIIGHPSFFDGKALNELTWVTGSEYWAVGQQGTILKSTDAGANWLHVLPEGTSTLADFDLQGVAFLNTSTGLFAGIRSGPVGAIYQYQDTGAGWTWTQLVLPSGVTISGLWDIEIAGTVAWAVGEKLVNGEPEGIVLTATASGGSFGAFTEVAGPTGGFARCLTGKGYDGEAVLTEVEIAPSTNEVWVGGACGRLWKRSTSGTWTNVKSTTDAHVVGMSFVPSGSGAAGYLGCFRASQTQQSIVRVQ